MQDLLSLSLKSRYFLELDKKLIILFLVFDLILISLLILVPSFYLFASIGFFILILSLLTNPNTGLYLLPIVLVNPVAIVPGTQYNIDEFLIFLLLLLFLVSIFLKDQESEVYLPKAYRWFLVLFLSGTSLSLLNVRYLEPALLHLIKLVLAFGFIFIYAYNQIKNQEMLKNILNMIILSGIIAAFYGIYQYYSGSVSITSGKRVFGLVGGNFGGFVGLAIVSLFSGIMFNRDYLKRIFFVILLIPLIWALLLSQTRAWILGTIVSIFAVLLFALYKKNQLKKLIVILLLISLIGIFFSGFMKSAFWDIYSSLFLRKVYPSTKISTLNLEKFPDFSVLARKSIWNFGLDLFLKYPVTGIGIANMRISNAFNPSLTYPRPYAGYADSHYINILAETGILGAIAWIFLIASILSYSKKIFRMAFTPDWYYISSSIVGSLILLLVGGIFWVITSGLIDSAIFALMISLLFIANKILIKELMVIKS